MQAHNYSTVQAPVSIGQHIEHEKAVSNYKLLKLHSYYLKCEITTHFITSLLLAIFRRASSRNNICNYTWNQIEYNDQKPCHALNRKIAFISLAFKSPYGGCQLLRHTRNSHFKSSYYHDILIYLFNVINLCVCLLNSGWSLFWYLLQVKLF